MLDSETKRHIDNARDILVGKVTDPKSQVDLITVALIYKFMDDMDLEAIELGGKRSFFVKDLKELAFSKIMDSKIGAQDRMKLYLSALEKLPYANSVPELFRKIFKDASLPFRDPQTLTLFLKEISNFSYDNSESLGNAFEYLLSIMGSQGDAGQFRTPRHIIDFIVQVINPQKNESILDPACGTAGFLISAFLYVKNNNKNLTPKEMQKFTAEIMGYDIDPGMQKLALVNLYLHKFAEPKIYEYDTLTSDEKWGQKFDVILANPPFMTPKGGIHPHSKFSVQANRSEVLFVDYIAEHLSINGRAGIIVPEGIIFQSATAAYKALRKMLLEDNFLWAVVSLPAGVFQPYSGVKTSILFLDKRIAKSKNEILFVKIENDGFDLGAQRRKIEKNDLPNALKILKDFAGSNTPTAEVGNCTILTVPKSKIAEDGEYNLTASRYAVNSTIENSQYDMVKLGDVAEIINGGTPDTKIQKYWNGDIEWITPAEMDDSKGIYIKQSRRKISKLGLENCSAYIIPKDSVILSTRAPIGYLKINENPMAFNQGCRGIVPKKDILLSKFLYFYLLTQRENLNSLGTGATFKELSATMLKQFQIPLPPLSVQKKIVEEIENKQQAIDHARRTIEILERERERVYFGSLLNGVKYKEVRLGEVGEINPKKSEALHTPNKTIVSFLPMEDIGMSQYVYPIKEKNFSEAYSKGYSYFRENDILLAKVTPCFENGKSGIAKKLKNGIGFGTTEIHIIRCSEKVIPEFIHLLIVSEDFMKQGKLQMTGTGGLQRLPAKFVENFKFPLPSLAEQKKITAQFSEEQEIINANKRLIEIMKGKIERVINNLLY